MILISNKFFGLIVRKGTTMEEKILKSTGRGFAMLFVSLLIILAGCGAIAYGGIYDSVPCGARF